MVSAEDIRNTVLQMAEKSNGRGVTAIEVARALRPSQWPEILEQVKLVVETLTQEGKLKPPIR